MNYDENKETIEMLEKFKEKGKDGAVFCLGVSCSSCPWSAVNLNCDDDNRPERYAKVLERLEALKGGAMKRGDRVYVSDKSEKEALKRKRERIFLANVGGNEGCICVGSNENYLYPDGGYRNTRWKYAVPIPKEKPVKEYTMEELVEKLGHEFKLVKGEATE